jgi:hypothetical protein
MRAKIPKSPPKKGKKAEFIKLKTVKKNKKGLKSEK